jgi:hypothetical protein
MTKSGVKIRHATNGESKRINDSQEVAVYVYETLLPRYEWVAQRNFEAKECAMEFCWHLLRKKIQQLCGMTEPMYGPRRARTPEQTAVRLIANQKA